MKPNILTALAIIIHLQHTFGTPLRSLPSITDLKRRSEVPKEEEPDGFSWFSRPAQDESSETDNFPVKLSPAEVTNVYTREGGEPPKDDSMTSHGSVGRSLVEAANANPHGENNAPETGNNDGVNSNGDVKPLTGESSKSGPVGLSPTETSAADNVDGRSLEVGNNDEVLTRPPKLGFGESGRPPIERVRMLELSNDDLQAGENALNKSPYASTGGGTGILEDLVESATELRV